MTGWMHALGAPRSLDRVLPHIDLSGSSAASLRHPSVMVPP